MRLYKILALVYRDIIIYTNMKWRIFEFLILPLLGFLIWGVFSYFIRDIAFEASLVLVMVTIILQFAQTNQSGINSQIMADSWSGSLKHIIVSGISGTEYVIARALSASVASTIMTIIALYLALNVLQITKIATHFPQVMLLIGLTLIASIGLSFLVAAIILYVGSEYSFIAWASSTIFIFFSSPLISIKALPIPLEIVSYFMPYTFIFESAANLMQSGAFIESEITYAVISALIYFIISLSIYKKMFIWSKKTGKIGGF